MSNQDIIIRLVLITLFASVIGYEREKQNSYAGFRTHLLVAITSTIIALIQQSIVAEVLDLHMAYPMMIEVVKADPGRLISTVVSGIGFLGAGTIIVTKRNITGLTTAASIWSVAGLGLAVGMGYLEVATIGFLFLTAVLFFAKRLFTSHFEERIYIEYIGGTKTMNEIEEVFTKLDLKSDHRGFTSKPFGNELIYASTFDVKGPKETDFRDLVSELSINRHIASVQLTNINQ